ncbi:hypothetical protein AAYR82_000561 [Salmonella enterica]|nr:hypothetical protein [Salmonella enterica subsp. arizonae]HEA0253377.1 hypothetical protein [Salmonella enterica]
MNMKKTLITLAITASAVVSASALAWNKGGTGGEFSISGTITPSVANSPWEVSVGSGASNINTSIDTGERTVNVSLPATPIIGIRSVKGGFTGGMGLSPQITFGSGAVVDTWGSRQGSSYIKLHIKDAISQQDIGVLDTSFVSAAMAYNGVQISALYASERGKAFKGGIPEQGGGY